jgi:hypothetical protein
VSSARTSRPHVRHGNPASKSVLKESLGLPTVWVQVFLGAACQFIVVWAVHNDDATECGRAGDGYHDTLLTLVLNV